MKLGTGHSDKPRETVEAGNHPGRLVWCIDIGTHLVPWEGESRPVHQIFIGFELYTDPMMKDGRPFMISRKYTDSLAPKSNLRAMLSNWGGKWFEESLAAPGKFNLKDYLGKPAMVTVTHYVGKDGNTYAKIGSVAPVPKSLLSTVTPQINATIWLDLDGSENIKDTVDAIPNFLKDMVKSSPEWEALNSHQLDEDLPF